MAVVEDFKSRFDLKGARVVLTVGNLTARKGQEVVIRALPRVLERVPELRYAMVGLPSERPRLQELARSLGVAHAVRVFGPLEEEDLVAAYNSCEVFAMTSQHTSSGDFEGYGIAVVEAAMCGKPAVVSSGSGLEEAVLDGETGVAVPQSDPGATADALIRLLEDTHLRLRLGDAALARAKAEQGWESRAKDYDRVLRSLTGEARLVEDLRMDSEAPA
jgi:glycosyltransferase involved in cell wall biosynthesis